MERDSVELSSERTAFVRNHAAILDELKRIHTKTQEIETILRSNGTVIEHDYVVEPPKKRMKYEHPSLVIHS